MEDNWRLLAWLVPALILLMAVAANQADLCEESWTWAGLVPVMPRMEWAK